MLLVVSGLLVKIVVWDAFLWLRQWIWGCRFEFDVLDGAVAKIFQLIFGMDCFAFRFFSRWVFGRWSGCVFLDSYSCFD